MAALVLAAASAIASAQPVFGPLATPPPNLPVPPAAAVARGSTPPAAAPTPPAAAFKWAGITAHPSFSYRRAFIDGMQIRPGSSGDTYLTSYSPSVALELGDRWVANYSASWSRYSNPAFDNNTGQSASISGAFQPGAWRVNFTQSYGASAEVLVETGRQTGQEVVTTRLGASRQVGPNLSISFGANQSLNFIERTEDPYEWSGTGGFSYRASEAIDVGFRLGVGYLAIEKTADSLYFRPSLTVGWQVTERTSLSLDAGMERRRLLGGSKREIDNPTLGLSLQLQPTQTTNLSFSVSRTVKHSYFRSELTEGTSWGASLQQRLLKHFQLAASYGRQESDYIATIAGLTTGRRDRTESYSIRLSTVILKRISIGGSLQHSENRSSFLGYGYSSRQLGGDVSLQF